MFCSRRNLRKTGFLLCVLATQTISAQITYRLSYTDSSTGLLEISIEPDTPLAGSLSFIMPRSVPGSYGVVKYDRFVQQPEALTGDGRTLTLTKNSLGAPRWTCSDSNIRIKRIRYTVDLKKMDLELHAAADKSISRPGFVGLLNYSVMGWIEGYDRKPVRYIVETLPSWPVFSTLAPTADPPKERLALDAADYYTLADAQTFIGPAFRVKEYKALVPLFVADYTETGPEELDGYGWQEAKSMEILKDYFGRLPFSSYTVLFRNAIPGPGDEPGNFGMEHLQSSTFFGDTGTVRTKNLTPKELWTTLPTYLHHMAHAYIPLRCYGDTYRPYVLEIPPVIDNIWFNEGFMWYIVYDTLKQKKWLNEFERITYHGPEAIRKMSLPQLSRIASTQYAEDFRLGSAVYARGALMAAGIDEYVRKKTAGKASMRTVYRYLYEWSVRHQRPFSMEEFPGLIKEATGLDISEIYNKWQKPVSEFAK